MPNTHDTAKSCERSTPPLPVTRSMVAQLYGLSVAEWLKVHLASHVALEAQERVSIGDYDGLHFKID